MLVESSLLLEVPSSDSFFARARCPPVSGPSSSDDPVRDGTDACKMSGVGVSDQCPGGSDPPLPSSPTPPPAGSVMDMAGLQGNTDGVRPSGFLPLVGTDRVDVSARFGDGAVARFGPRGSPAK